MQKFLRRVRPLLRSEAFRLLGSMKLAGVLLAAFTVLLWCAALVPQGQERELYVTRWGADTYATLQVLGLIRVTGSWYFWVVAGLLILNLAASALDRYTQSVLQEVVPLKRANFESLEHGKGILRLPEPPERAVETLKQRLQQKDFAFYVLSGDKFQDRQLYATKGIPALRTSTLAHAGLLLVAIGLLLGRLFGTEGTLLISPGKPQTLPAWGEEIKLGIDQFTPMYRLEPPLAYPDAAGARLQAVWKGVQLPKKVPPARYVLRDQEARLAVYSGKERMGQRSVRTGRPLRYRGVSVYVVRSQQQIKLGVSVARRGRKPQRTQIHDAAIGQTLIIPDVGYVRVSGIISGMLQRPDGSLDLIQPFLQMALWKPDRTPAEVRALPPDRNVQLVLKKQVPVGPAFLSLADFQESVQVRYGSDPGYLLVLLGGLVTAVGWAMRLWLSHYRIHWYLEPLDEGSHLLVACKESGAFADGDELVAEMAGSREVTA